MAKKTDDDTVAFGLTRKAVCDAIDAISQEYDENNEDTSTYSAYAESMRKGRDALKKQESYYPHINKEGRSN